MSCRSDSWCRLDPEYAALLAHVPVLAPADELALARRARTGDAAARDRLIEGSLRFVVRAVRPYRRRGVDLMDLVAEGNAALLRAAQTFDPERGHRFVSYAVWWIRDASQRFLARMAGATAFPTARAAALLRKEAHHNPVRRDRWSDGSELAAAQSDGGIERVIEALDREVRHRQLRRAVDELPPRVRQCVTRYHGLDGEDPGDFRAIGRLQRISRETARCDYRMALERLRESLSSMD